MKLGQDFEPVVPVQNVGHHVLVSHFNWVLHFMVIFNTSKSNLFFSNITESRHDIICCYKYLSNYRIVFKIVHE